MPTPDKFDKILAKLIEHDEKFDIIQSQLGNFVTKDEFYSTTDQILTIVKRLDQERVFTGHRITRIEKRLGI